MTTELETPSADAHRNWIENADVRKLQIGCWIAFIAIALVRAWFTRYAFDGDSAAYLDIARAIAEGHPGSAIHAYWSPGYPVLLSFFLWLFHPNVYWECPLAHFVNLLIFVGTLASFQLFWGELRFWHENYADDLGTQIPKAAFWALGYSIFGIAILNIITVALVGPDMLMAAFCCLVAWSTLRLRRVPSFAGALLLGCILALGYYAKAPLFPMSLVFILCACFCWPLSRRAVLLGAVALVTFLLVSAPFVAALSHSKGRLTFGDAARLNYGFFIDGVEHYKHWQGGPPGSGMPVHPTRKLNDYPEIYEFAAKNIGSYPAWFDPTYWYEGITPHFELNHQAKFFVAALILESQIIMDAGAELILAAIILALLASYRWQWTKGVARLWFIWAPGVIGLVMFALVHIEPRFLGGWLILVLAGAICVCSLPASGGTRRGVECVGLAALITVGAALTLQASREAVGADHALGRSSHDAAIAEFLLNNGLHPDDDVALIGNGFEAYWAHLARLHVVAEIPANIRSNRDHPAFDFWTSGLEQQQKALRRLERTGVKAVIADPQNADAGSPPSVVPAPWKKIDETGAYICFFPARR